MVCDECRWEAITLSLIPNLLNTINEDGAAAPKLTKALRYSRCHARPTSISQHQHLGVCPGTVLSLRLYGIT